MLAAMVRAEGVELVDNRRSHEIALIPITIQTHAPPNAGIDFTITYDPYDADKIDAECV